MCSLSVKLGVNEGVVADTAGTATLARASTAASATERASLCIGPTLRPSEPSALARMGDATNSDRVNNHPHLADAAAAR